MLVSNQFFLQDFTLDGSNCINGKLSVLFICVEISALFILLILRNMARGNQLTYPGLLYGDLQMPKRPHSALLGSRPARLDGRVRPCWARTWTTAGAVARSALGLLTAFQNVKMARVVSTATTMNGMTAMASAPTAARPM